MTSGILPYMLIFIDFGNIRIKIAVRLTKRQLEYIVKETTKENITIRQLVRITLMEHLIKRI